MIINFELSRMTFTIGLLREAEEKQKD